MSRQDIFGHRYYQPDDPICLIPMSDQVATKTVSIVPHNGAYLAECLDCEGDVTFYLEGFERHLLLALVRHLVADRADVKIDEGESQ